MSAKPETRTGSLATLPHDAEQPPVVIGHASFPHIIDLIIANAPVGSLQILRTTSWDMYKLVAPRLVVLLAQHLVIEQSSSSLAAPIIRSRFGSIPQVSQLSGVSAECKCRVAPTLLPGERLAHELSRRTRTLDIIGELIVITLPMMGINSICYPKLRTLRLRPCSKGRLVPYLTSFNTVRTIVLFVYAADVPQLPPDISALPSIDRIVLNIRRPPGTQPHLYQAWFERVPRLRHVVFHFERLSIATPAVGYGEACERAWALILIRSLVRQHITVDLVVGVVGAGHLLGFGDVGLEHWWTWGVPALQRRLVRVLDRDEYAAEVGEEQLKLETVE